LADLSAMAAACSSAQSPSTPVRIAILGGGIGGLALLLGILRHTSRDRIEPHLYEAAPTFGEIGAGVAFGSNSIRAMELLDPAVAAAYLKHATFNMDSGARDRKVWSGYRMGMDGKGDRNHLKAGDSIHEVRVSVERSSVHRARFLEAMTELLPDGYVTFGKRLVGVVENLDPERVKLEFEDGTLAEADAIIGCDGIKSKVRPVLLAGDDNIDPVFTGKVAYRGLIPMKEAVAALGEWSAQNAHFHWGYDGHILTFPIEHGETMNVVAFTTSKNGEWEHGSRWVIPGNREQMLSDFEGWGNDVQAILRMMKSTDIWALFDHPPARTYYRAGRICLLGDCAHASTPHQGSGAGMAIEDALVLSQLLGQVQEKTDLQKAFKAYDAVRRPRTQKLVSTSRDAGCLYEFQKEGVRDDVEALRNNLEGRMRWVWDIDLEKHLQEAMRIYRE
jgi:salicylate hydroxylase